MGDCDKKNGIYNFTAPEEKKVIEKISNLFAAIL